MLRQLARLTHPVPAAGPDALAVAVYSDVVDRPVLANESGFEGVACVDDAARLLDVLCDVWTATQLPWVERWARGLLEFETLTGDEITDLLAGKRPVRESVIEPTTPRSSAVPPAGKPRPRPEPPTGEVAPQPQA